jgi:hypothetical protein
MAGWKPTLRAKLGYYRILPFAVCHLNSLFPSAAKKHVTPHPAPSTDGLMKTHAAVHPTAARISPSPYAKPHQRRKNVAHGDSRGITGHRESTLSRVAATEDLRSSRQVCRPSRGFSGESALLSPHGCRRGPHSCARRLTGSETRSRVYSSAYSGRPSPQEAVCELVFAVIPRSRRRRGISHCLENTQSEIPRGVYPEHPERDSFTSFRTGSSQSLP